MTPIKPTKTKISEYKKQAKARSKSTGVTKTQALNDIAKSLGFYDWSKLVSAPDARETIVCWFYENFTQSAECSLFYPRIAEPADILDIISDSFPGVSGRVTSDIADDLALNDEWVNNEFLNGY
jgi:hypothetical protein